MRYFKCRCGQRQFWSDFGPPTCVLCEQCSTTPASGPNGHLTVASEHQWDVWTWRIDSQTGHRWQERRCMMCFTVERREAVEVAP